MAKNKRKRSKKKKDYEVGYKKPPKDCRWEKGCPSPNPKGRPKKPRSLKEAMQITLNKEINIKNEKGELKKITGAEALVNRTLADAIAKDGATRRMFFKDDLLNLPMKEQEYEYPPDEQKLLEIEKEYGELLHEFAEMGPKFREIHRQRITEELRDKSNEICREQYRKKYE